MLAVFDGFTKDHIPFTLLEITNRVGKNEPMTSTDNHPDPRDCIALVVSAVGLRERSEARTGTNLSKEGQHETQ